MKRNQMKTVLLALCGTLALGVTYADHATDPAIPYRPWTRSMFLQRFEAKKALAAQGGYGVVFVGDSITHFWEGAGHDVWTNRFASGEYRALNVGISGDRTEHVLWRLDHGQLDGTDPKAVVLMIGTNNTGHWQAEDESVNDTVLGIRAIVERLRKRFPRAKLILHPIFPRGAKPSDAPRVRNDLVNLVVGRTLPDGKDVLWCDFNAKLLEPDGTLTREMAPDLLHPGKRGYEIWADELKPYLDYAFGKTAEPPKPGNPPPAGFDRGPGNCPYVRSDGPWPTVANAPTYWLVRDKSGRMAAKRRQIRSNPEKYYDVVFAGDSITHRWDEAGKSVFESRFAKYKVLNVGFGGDCVENLTWNALYGGLFDGYQTRLVMLMIGTNNGEKDPEEIAKGIRRAIDEIRRKQPAAKVLLLPIFPRFAKADDPWRLKNDRVNAIIRGYADGKRIFWHDFNARFLNAEGAANKDLMPDFCHPNAAGYEIWAEEVLPVFKRLLGC